MIFKMGEQKNKGCLVLIGGGEDRRQEKTVLRRVVEINNAKNIAVIPTATSYSRECGATYIEAFKSLGVTTINVIDVRYRDEADDPKYSEMLKEADCIFFTGGDQVRLVEILNGTKLLAEIRRKFAIGTTIAGTSAGAAAASHPMIFSWSDEDFLFNKGCVTYGDGFGFIEGLVVDTHFIERGRIPRLAQILATGICGFGIGVAEDTGAIIYPDFKIEVVGSGLVTILGSDKMVFTNYHQVHDNEPVAIDGLKLTFLGEGTIYDMKKGITGVITKEDTHIKVPMEDRFGFIPKINSLGGWS